LGKKLNNIIEILKVLYTKIGKPHTGYIRKWFWNIFSWKFDYEKKWYSHFHWLLYL